MLDVTAPQLSATTALALTAQATEDLRAGRLARAEQALRLVLESRPEDADARYLMGVVALRKGHGAAAAALLLPEARRRPNSAQAQYNAGTALVLIARFHEAAELLRRALALDPGLAPAWNNLGNILKAFGDIEQAIQCYQKAISLRPEDLHLHGHYLICAHYSAAFSHQEIFALHEQWAQRHAASYYPRAPMRPVNPDPERELTVGLVSPSFNGKIVGNFLHGVLPLLGQQRMRLVAYSSTLETDGLTSQLRASVDRWRDVASLSDDALAQRIVADGVDVLIDLAGHAPGNRLLVFARRPAPVQVSWLDYFDTTGLRTMDFLVSDARTTPPETAQGFTEQLLILPETRLCWTPPDFAPPVAPAPCQKRGFVTFGSFNRAEKLNPQLIEIWAQILTWLPDARLLMKGPAFGMDEVRRHFGERFAARGVSSERIEWRGASPHPVLLGEYGDVDIALDPTPYNGGATTCDALWMGVPVIALRGERMIARQSAAMLDCLGIADLVAATPEQYVQLAVDLAKDRERVIALRQTIRPIMAASPLCNAPLFAGRLAAVIREAWRACCSRIAENQGVNG